MEQAMSIFYLPSDPFDRKPVRAVFPGDRKDRMPARSTTSPSSGAAPPA
jgi:hypothetical protein